MKIKGFTLLELLVTLFLVVGLSLFGVASYSYLLNKNEKQQIIDELKMAVRYARIQSRILGDPVVLMPLNSLDWSEGMQVSAFSQKGLRPLHQWQWSHPQWNLKWEGLHTSGKIIFYSSPTHALSNGHFTLSHRGTGQDSILILNRLGRIKTDSLSLAG